MVKELGGVMLLGTLHEEGKPLAGVHELGISPTLKELMGPLGIHEGGRS